MGLDVVMIPAGNHRVDWVTTYPLRVMLGMDGAGADGHPASRGDIVVGNDVWIGFGATILSGVTIGDGAVVGARAVVARDVRPYAVVVGNPAREIRRRFDDATVERLLTLRWWEWPLEEIRRRVPLLCDQDVQRLLDESRRTRTEVTASGAPRSAKNPDCAGFFAVTTAGERARCAHPQ